MGIFRTTVVAAFVATAGASVLLAADEHSDADRGFITRDYTWIDGGSITFLTVYGPAEQVNAFDPQDSHLTCEGCELTSSIQFGPKDEAIPIEAAAKPGSKY